MCDFWFIDGGHSARVVAADAAAARAMAARGATVVFDDVAAASSDCAGPRGVWEALLLSGAVRAAAPGKTIGGREPFTAPGGAVVPGTAAGYLEAIGTFVVGT